MRSDVRGSTDGLAADELRVRRAAEEQIAEGRAPEERAPEEHSVLTIDCGTCELHHTSACSDCVVSFVCDRRAGEAVLIDVSEARAIRLLGTGGLVPELRHRRRTGWAPGSPNSARTG